MGPYRGRFAPSPTGDLHVGSAATALLAWLLARQAGGQFVLRVEDVDAPRVLPGCEGEQLRDLRWLGLDWDEGPDVGGALGPYRQSDRSDRYEDALARLAAAGHLYLCDCSRREIAGVASAPHAGEEGPRYPGTCRRHGMKARTFRRPPALRLRVPSGEVSFVDRWQGEQRQDVEAAVGDFVLRRGDGVFAYQFAVVVDDLAMGITEVVRGIDLLSSAPRQILLARLLGGQPPAFAHGPLVVGEDGRRLEKRNPAHTLRGWREAGGSSEALRRHLWSALGGTLAENEPASPVALLARFEAKRWKGKATVRWEGQGSSSPDLDR